MKDMKGPAMDFKEGGAKPIPNLNYIKNYHSFREMPKLHKRPNERYRGSDFVGRVITFILGFILVLLPYSITLAETHWAVLVGIDKYQSPEITALRGAANDAKSLAEVLKKEMRFPEKNVFVYTSDSLSPNQPTTGNIVRGLKYVVEKAQTGDTFILFFSGQWYHVWRKKVFAHPAI
jgi:hypothetical protein